VGFPVLAGALAGVAEVAPGAALGGAIALTLAKVLGWLAQYLPKRVKAGRRAARSQPFEQAVLQAVEAQRQLVEELRRDVTDLAAQIAAVERRQADVLERIGALDQRLTTVEGNQTRILNLISK